MSWNADPVRDWLLREGRLRADPLALTDALAGRLVAAGAPLWRLRLGVFTLHPQVAARAYVWRRGERATLERFPHGVRESAAFRGSPAEKMMQTGRLVRYRLDRLDPSAHRLLHALAAEGGRDYALLPLRFSDGSLNVFALATDAPAGFGAGDLVEFERLGDALGAVLEALETRHLAATLLDTYVGHRTGGRILAGKIQRGAADVIQAAIWYADLRDFTLLTETLPAPRLLEMLNAYFELIAAAVTPRGGEILRFMGDAMLIVFPAAKPAELAPACAAALEAARDAFARLEALNAARCASGCPELRFGVGLNAGEVIYGNVGSPDRLDFTVIGPAVNRAARLEGLTKDLGVPLLMSAEFARCLALPVRALGSHRVRGLPEPLEVWGLEDRIETAA
jgi:adenylate cyclase